MRLAYTTCITLFIVVNFQTSSSNTFQDVNYCLVFLVKSGWTDRQKATHMSSKMKELDIEVNKNKKPKMSVFFLVGHYVRTLEDSSIV